MSPELDRIPFLPRDHDGPVFREPWEAHAFALAVELHAHGVFTWSEWAAALADEIARAEAAGHPDTGETYYRHWLSALEGLIVCKGLATFAKIEETTRAWHIAAERTPHGQQIELSLGFAVFTSAEGRSWT